MGVFLRGERFPFRYQEIQAGNDSERGLLKVQESFERVAKEVEKG